MFTLNIFKSMPSFMNTIICRAFTADKRLKFLSGINYPPRIFKPGEETNNNIGLDEESIWKEQRSLYKLDTRGPLVRKKRRHPLDKRPQMSGIVLKTLIKKPKKPNSANRKCVFLRLSNGREMTAFVPGIGHNLQEHSRVLVELNRTKDVPGLRLRVIRGVYDCSLVYKQSQK